MWWWWWWWFLDLHSIFCSKHLGFSFRKEQVRKGNNKSHICKQLTEKESHCWESWCTEFKRHLCLMYKYKERGLKSFYEPKSKGHCICCPRDFGDPTLGRQFHGRVWWLQRKSEKSSFGWFPKENEKQNTETLRSSDLELRKANRSQWPAQTAWLQLHRWPRRVELRKEKYIISVKK